MGNFFVFSFLLLLITPSFSENAKYSLCNAQLPSPRGHVGAIYDDDDSIYLFGGEGYTGIMDEILLYTISTDSLALVGHLSTPGYFFRTNSISVNSEGIFHAFATDPKLKVTKFDSKTNESSLALNTTIMAYNAPFVQLSDEEAIHIGDLGSEFPCDLLRTDLTKMETSFLGKVCTGLYYFRTDGVLSTKEEIVYFIAKENHDPGFTLWVMQYDVKEKELKTRLQIDDIFDSDASAVWANDQMYIIGVKGEDYEEFVAAYDPNENSFSPLEVDGLTKNHGFKRRAAVYVEKFQRVYLFGGYNGGNTADIWKIDLNFDATTEPIDPTISTTPTPSSSHRLVYPTLKIFLPLVVSMLLDLF